MKIEQKYTLKSMVPLMISILIIAMILILSLIYDIQKYPFLIKEGGVIETLSAIGYFIAALLMLIKGKWSYVKKYHYFFIAVILFGLRELDFDKRFTTIGIFKIKDYLNNNMPVYEKLIGLLVILLILYCVVAIIINHSKSYFPQIKAFSTVHIGVFVTILLLLFTKSIDGFGRKVKSFNIVIDAQTSTYLGVIEEVLELGIPLFIIITLLSYYSNENMDDL